MKLCSLVGYALHVTYDLFMSLAVLTPSGCSLPIDSPTSTNLAPIMALLCGAGGFLYRHM